jgi:hypothetical protein
MIVSDSKSFVFVHNPKVAGTSVRLTLNPWRNPGKDFWGWDLYPQAGGLIDLAHMPLDLLIQLHPEIFMRMQSFFAFGFVRNPWQRYFSSVSRYLLWTTDFNKAAVTRTREGFERYASDFILANLDKDRMGYDYRLIHFLPQKRFFFMFDNPVVKYFRMEDLETGEFPAELAALGLQGMRKENVSEPHLKVNGEFDPNGLTPEARAKVLEFYREDFEAFGYQP